MIKDNTNSLNQIEENFEELIVERCKFCGFDKCLAENPDFELPRIDESLFGWENGQHITIPGMSGGFDCFLGKVGNNHNLILYAEQSSRMDHDSNSSSVFEIDINGARLLEGEERKTVWEQFRQLDKKRFEERKQKVKERKNMNTTSEALRPKFATRTVLFDEDGRVAIINVKRHGYYKIPGGGIEDGENIKDAAMREVKEESGCNCNITGELGRIETEVPVWQMLDISDGFIATVQGKKSQPDYEAWEKERGFELEWFQDIDTAISIIEGNTASEPGTEALQGRDLAFLKLAREAIKTVSK